MQVIIWPLLNNQWSEALISAAPHLVFKYGGHERGPPSWPGRGEERRSKNGDCRSRAGLDLQPGTGYPGLGPRDTDDTLDCAVGGGVEGRDAAHLVVN